MTQTIFQETKTELIFSLHSQNNPSKLQLTNTGCAQFGNWIKISRLCSTITKQKNDNYVLKYVR
jgi:hypothetical protein